MSNAATIKRGEVLTWLRVGGFVLPMIATVVIVAVKLSADATELKRDVSELTERVDRIAAIDAKIERLSLQFVALDERIAAQNANVQRFWSVTWPSLEGRLSRIETALEDQQ